MSLRLQSDRININRLARSHEELAEPLPDLEDTQTSKNILRIERTASRKLKVLTDIIKRDRAISQVVKGHMQAVVRRLVQDSYNEGVKYVAQFAKVEPFLTSTDLTNIQNYSKQYYETLEARLSRFVLTRDPNLSEITDTFIVEVVASALTTNVLFNATLSKANQIFLNDTTLANNPRTLVTETAAASSKKKYTKLVGFQFDAPPAPGTEGREYTKTGYLKPSKSAIPQYGEAGYPGPLPQRRVLVWHTARDDRVCDYCSQYEGFTVPLEESHQMPTPHRDTHPHCRCRVILAITLLKIERNL